MSSWSRSRLYLVCISKTSASTCFFFFFSERWKLKREIYSFRIEIIRFVESAYIRYLLFKVVKCYHAQVILNWTCWRQWYSFLNVFIPIIQFKMKHNHKATDPWGRACWASGDTWQVHMTVVMGEGKKVTIKGPCR